ncbi:flagellar hook-associated protein FlgK [Erythrobacter crassostreae]|uniref:Flagellar hook-associated protein 1 n=1 Tax=Erythrobacter crassostreae TaxID=2828328 RepID=A0A9X1F2M2_9SPHN|nr:flagellar hook-associated protein FlgK [Erythrobacter crassostrea]MBV7258917.1 flagellar hook-associated protein FlgK [Erythrobacter crassostrea]
MPTALISIGRSGAAAARASLELTAQNIANASNPDYARRTLDQSEVVGSATIGLNSANSYGGVRIGTVARAESELVQIQFRSATADLARTDAEMNGLRGAETAIEQSRLFESLVDFEAELVRLESDPLDPVLRTSTLETARQLTNTFQLANGSLAKNRDLLQSEITASMQNAQGIADELARTNAELVKVRDGTAAKAALLDARDASLRDLSQQFGIEVQFDDFGTANVSLAGTPQVTLVSGANAATLGFAADPEGRVEFNVDGQAFTPSSGALSGRQSALDEMAAMQVDLDAIASQIITSANAAQAGGSTSSGGAAPAFFTGNSASNIEVALASGSDIATAPAGAPVGSRDVSNLRGLIGALSADNGPAAATDTLLLGVSSRISGLDTRRDGLSIIAQSAETALLTATGVDLDAEAAALVRLQQAFEANSRIIQVAADLFDTILALR